MEKFAKEYKEQLGELLALGHAKFGKVKARRAYRDDDEGGSGSGELLFETHPFLADLPEGASSDLTSIVTHNNNAEAEADNRDAEATPELKQKLAQRQQLGARHLAQPTPTG